MNLKLFTYDQLQKYRDEQSTFILQQEIRGEIYAMLNDELEFNRTVRRADSARDRLALVLREIKRRDDIEAARDLHKKRKDSLRVFSPKRGIGSY